MMIRGWRPAHASYADTWLVSCSGELYRYVVGVMLTRVMLITRWCPDQASGDDTWLVSCSRE